MKSFKHRLNQFTQEALGEVAVFLSIKNAPTPFYLSPARHGTKIFLTPTGFILKYNLFMKLIFTALIILIGIQSSFCASVTKKKPTSKEYNFYKVGDKYLFKVKDGFMYYGNSMIKKGSN